MLQYCNISYFSLSYFNILDCFEKSRAYIQELHHIIFKNINLPIKSQDGELNFLIFVN